jgi:hypothetical protein
MKKSKLLGLITEVLYLLNLIASIVLAVYLKLEIDEAKMQTSEGTEAIGTALGAAILAVLLIFTLIYVIYSFLPLLFKTLQLMFSKKGFCVACMVFDTISFLGAATVFVSLVMGEGTLGGLVIFLIPASLFAAAFVLNLLTYKAIGTEEGEEFSEETSFADPEN